jgi:glycosyltransferase involved in cell wall biosynthesis
VLELQDRVVLLGRLDEEQTLARIAASDVLVLPSFMEGLPIVLMEAMALGVPVIATRVAGVPELISDEQQGLLFCPADWGELAERMARLLTDPPLRKRLGQAGRAKVEAQFEIGRAVEPLIARFTNVAAG